MNKVPPHNLEAEQQLLGAIFYEASNFEKIKGKLYPNDFYKEAHQKIYQAIMDLDEVGEHIDLLTVNQILKQQGQLDKVGGPAYLSELTDNLITSSNIESAFKLVKRDANKRWLIKIARECENACLNGEDPSEIVFFFQKEFDLMKQEISSLDSQSNTLNKAIFDIANIDELLIPERKNIISPWQKEESITLISGPRGIGKSMGAIGLVDAISKKTSFGPWRVEYAVPCLYLDGEMPISDLKERFQKFEHNLSSKSPLYLYSDHYATMKGLPRANLLDETWRVKIKSYLLDKGVKLWVVDNLASLTPGIDENLKKDWDPINQWLLELRFAGISTIMLHHTGKDGGQRGTSAREDNIDTSIIMRAPSGYVKEDGCSFILSFTKARVYQKELGLIADYHFRLFEKDGRYLWEWESVKKENRRTVLELLGQGIGQKEIAETLDLSKGFVSKIRSQAVKDGLITPENKLTPSGYGVVYV